MSTTVPVRIACAVVDWEFRCPQRWDSLALTGDKGVRFCWDCRQRVYLCNSVGQVNRRARLGQCIAWAPGGYGEAPADDEVHLVGMVAIPEYEISIRKDDDTEGSR